MPTFEAFCGHLNKEQSKLTQLDTMIGSKMKALVAQKSLGKPKHNSNSIGSEISSKSSPKSDPHNPLRSVILLGLVSFPPRLRSTQVNLAIFVARKDI
jgi:hypothetical protein